MIRSIKLILLLCVFFALPQHLAKANWREEIGVFRIGVVVTDNIAGNLARMEPFRLAITEALEMDVEFFPASNSISVIDALATERIEYAILSASGYALTSVRCECVEPLVVPRSTDSTDGYHLTGIMRAGESFDVTKLPSMKAAALSPGAITGAAFIKFLLEDDYPAIEPGSISFENVSDSESTLENFSHGEYDILFGWSSMTGNPSEGYSRGSLRQIVARTGEAGSQYQIVWKSDQIPHHPHVLRKKLPGEVKQRLRNALVGLYDNDPVAYDSIEPIYGGGFTAARNERFRELVSFLNSIEQELAIPDATTEGSVVDAH